MQAERRSPHSPLRSAFCPLGYPPGRAAPPQHHARSAFITAYVLSGSIRSPVDNGKVQMSRAGESWTEAPGAHHQISENASATCNGIANLG